MTPKSVIAAAARDAGLDPRRLIEASKNSDTKAQLHHAITDAVALGVFGVPSFVLDGEVYWGNDRLILLRWALTGSGRRCHSQLALGASSRISCASLFE